VRWRRRAGSLTLRPGPLWPRLTRPTIVLDHRGVSAAEVRTRTWPWSDVAYLTWNQRGSGRPHLAVCVKGDPYPRELPIGAPDAGELRGLLEDARSFVEAHRSRVGAGAEAAGHWWYLEPEARGRPPRE
jgi:hypothetical protein